MTAFLPLIWSGLLAAAVMALFLVEVEKLGWAKSDMFWTIGSIFSKSRTTARTIGLTVHALAGVIFAVIYVMIWSVFTPLTYNDFVKIGILTGAIHGLAVAFSQIVILAGSKKGFNVALTHVSAHVLFGLVLGAIVGLLENRYDSVSNIAKIVSGGAGVQF